MKKYSHYLFNFKNHLNELQDCQDDMKKEIVRKYQMYYGDHGSIEETFLYRTFLTSFIPPSLQYNLPLDLTKSFDWDLLIRLGVASFSSEIRFQPVHGGMYEIIIEVTSEDRTIVKKVSELYGFQILRLFEIWCEELIQLSVLCHEEETEKAAILAQLEKNKLAWQVTYQHLSLSSVW